MKNEDVIEYFWRNPQGFVPVSDPFAGPDIPENSIPRPGTWRPNPVDDEDQKEKFRSIIEYSFYMPPSGLKFDNDEYRGHLADVLHALENHEKSMVVIASDLEMALSAESKLGVNHENLFNSYVSLFFLVDSASEKSFEILSKSGAEGLNREKIVFIFRRAWDSPLVEYQVAKKSFNTWQALAREKWEKPEEQELSKWILSLKPPKNPAVNMGA